MPSIFTTSIHTQFATAFCFVLLTKNNTTSSPGFHGQQFNNLQRAALLTSFWHNRFNNLKWHALLTSYLQWAALLTSFWRYWFNNLQWAALLTSFWRHWFNNLQWAAHHLINNLQRAALLTSLVHYDKILSNLIIWSTAAGYAVYYACGFNQSEMGKYFEWIIIHVKMKYCPALNALQYNAIHCIALHYNSIQCSVQCDEM